MYDKPFISSASLPPIPFPSSSQIRVTLLLLGREEVFVTVAVAVRLKPLELILVNSTVKMPRVSGTFSVDMLL